MHELPILDGANSISHPPEKMAQKKASLLSSMQEWCEEIRSEFGIACGYFLGSAMHGLEDILKHYTDGENYDLIVAGTDGADSLYQYYFGPKSYHIVKQAKCPILIIPQGISFKAFSSVVYVTNQALEAKNRLKQLPEAFRRHLTMLSSNQQDPARKGGNLEVLEDSRQAQVELHHQTNFHTESPEDIVEGLQQYVEEYDPDLIIFSNQPKDILERMLPRNFARELINTIGKPVLVCN